MGFPLVFPAGAIIAPLDSLSHGSLFQLLTHRWGLIATLFVFLVVKYVRSPWRRVPPGPRGLPILGNSLQLQNKGWMFDKECKRKFEHVMYMNVLGQPIIVLHSLKAAFELLDRRANIYSDRPRYIVAHEILCGGLFLPYMSCGDLWRRFRRASQEVLKKIVVRDYYPVYCKEAILLAAAMLESPDASDEHIQRSSASATLSILYDYPTLENEHDKNVTGVRTFVDRISVATTPGAYLVELLPWMIHIPERFAKWKREGMEHFKQHSAMFNGLLDTVSSDIAKGSERPSASASLLKNSDRSGLSKNEISWILGTLFGGGAETTATTLAWWARAMIAYPEIQKRAQDELDAVVGRSRTPTFADAPNLPYIQALVKESLRWRPAFPFGAPRNTKEDDWYEGMFIPKGTLCLVNMWQCHRDTTSYGPDAASFNPGRFLDEHGRLVPGPPETRDDGHCSYGFGRRACVGKHAANDSMFICIAMVLWAVQLEYARDDNGEEIPIDLETFIDTGMIFQPLPFKCKIIPRFPEVSTILMEELELLKA